MILNKSRINDIFISIINNSCFNDAQAQSPYGH